MRKSLSCLVLLAACGDNANPDYHHDDQDPYWHWDAQSMVGAYSLDERSGPTLEPILQRIDELDDRVLVLYGHTAEHGVTPETVEAVFKRAREDGVDILTFADLARGGVKRPGVVVSFDDTQIDEWYAMRDIYARYDAHATFFVTGYPVWTDEGRQKLHTLYDEGHSIEAHSITHPYICAYVEEFGIEAYINNEVLPSMKVLSDDGFTPVAYAFPGGSMGNAIVDELAPMIPITRGITYLPQ